MVKKLSIFLCVVAAVFCNIFVLERPAAAAGVDIGVLAPDMRVRGADINDKGLVVGTANVTVHETHAFLYKDGAMQDLGTLGGNSYAESVNELGQVVGWSLTASGDSHAFLWADGQMIDLTQYLQSAKSYAYDINDNGVVVGMRQMGDGYHAFSFNLATKSVTDLGVGGARAVNNAGQVAGYSIVAPGNERAAIWNNGILKQLQPLENDTRSVAYDINDQGDTVGWSGHMAERQIAVEWKGVTPTMIAPDAYSASQVVDSNNHGMAVGSTYNDAIGQCAFIWNGEVAAEPKPDDGGWCYVSGYAINNHGQYIVSTWEASERTMILSEAVPENPEEPAEPEPWQWYADIIADLKAQVEKMNWPSERKQQTVARLQKTLDIYIDSLRWLPDNQLQSKAQAYMRSALASMQ